MADRAADRGEPRVGAHPICDPMHIGVPVDMAVHRVVVHILLAIAVSLGTAAFYLDTWYLPESDLEVS